MCIIRQWTHTTHFTQHSILFRLQKYFFLKNEILIFKILWKKTLRPLFLFLPKSGIDRVLKTNLTQHSILFDFRNAFFWKIKFSFFKILQKKNFTPYFFFSKKSLRQPNFFRKKVSTPLFFRNLRAPSSSPVSYLSFLAIWYFTV